jgi:hypothetical protein
MDRGDKQIKTCTRRTAHTKEEKNTKRISNDSSEKLPRWLAPDLAPKLAPTRASERASHTQSTEL